MTFSRALQKGRNANVGMTCRVAQSEEIRHKLLCKENEADTKLLRFAADNLHLKTGQEGVSVRMILVITVITIANIDPGLVYDLHCAKFFACIILLNPYNNLVVLVHMEKL